MRYLRKFTGDSITSADVTTPSLDVNLSQIPTIFKSSFNNVSLDDLPIRVKTRAVRNRNQPGRRVVSAPTFDLVAPMNNLSLSPPPRIADTSSMSSARRSLPALPKNRSNHYTRQVSMPLQTLHERAHSSSKESLQSSYTNIISIYQEFSPSNHPCDYLKHRLSNEALTQIKSHESSPSIQISDASSSSSNDDSDPIISKSLPPVQQQMDMQKRSNSPKNISVIRLQSKPLPPQPAKRVLSNPTEYCNHASIRRKPPQPLTQEELKRYPSHSAYNNYAI